MMVCPIQLRCLVQEACYLVLSMFLLLYTFIFMAIFTIIRFLDRILRALMSFIYDFIMRLFTRTEQCKRSTSRCRSRCRPRSCRSKRSKRRCRWTYGFREALRNPFSIINVRNFILNKLICTNVRWSFGIPLLRARWRYCRQG